MNDKDFDKIFGDKLRQERPFSSLESDWNNLSERLDKANLSVEKEKKRRFAMGFWLLPLLLMLPIAALLMWQINDLKQQNRQFASEMSKLQGLLDQRKVQHDTVFKTDTIYIQQNNNSTNSFKTELNRSNFDKNQKIPPSVSEGFSSIKTENKFSATQSTNTIKIENTALETAQIQTNKDTTTPKQISELLNKMAVLEKQIADLTQSLMDKEAKIALLSDCTKQQNELKKQLTTLTTLTDSLQKHPLSTTVLKEDKILKNNRLYVGIKGGQIQYKTTWFNSLGIELYKDLKSYQAGLAFEYALTDKIRLTAAGDFCPVSYQIFWQDPRYNLPALQFDPAKEKYQKAESKQNLLQANIGAKYFFTAGAKRWRPFVGTAYTLMRIQPFNTKFTYTPLWGTTPREQTVQSKAVNVPNLLLLNGGLEYRFSKYGVAQAEAFYYKDINKTAKTFNLFGLRAAVLLNL